MATPTTPLIENGFKLFPETNSLSRLRYFFGQLLTQRDLSAEQSRAVNSRLILLLANHIGDPALIAAAVAAARAGVIEPAGGTAASGLGDGPV